MRPANIISAYKGSKVIYNEITDKSQFDKEYFPLKKSEIETLSKFCELLKKFVCEFDLFDGYYIGYSIKQISKEFDLLRLSDDLVINIELKMPLDEEEKVKKITEQMHKNYYYLKFLGKKVSIYTFVADDGLYKYDEDNNKCSPVEIESLICELKSQTINDTLDLDTVFVPSKYLISPFNNEDRFISNEYFLTDNQQSIKKEIITMLNSEEFGFFCISANAGTGKTLLLYDVAKSILNRYGDDSNIIFHCGKLNEGQRRLNDKYKWNIHSIADVQDKTVDKLIHKNLEIIVLDEAQRIHMNQLKMIMDKAIDLNIPILFGYDKKQYLFKGENLDLYDYIINEYENIKVFKRELKGKIRTNKEMASFITNLFDFKKSNSNLNYESISIDYFETIEEVKKYVRYLETAKGWKAVKYSTSKYTLNSLDYLLGICSSTAHDVIGQEYDKVVLVMDKHFAYDQDNKLRAGGSYYSAKGMLYQIVTRVVNQLKIIVLENPELYCKLLEIKALGKKEKD